MKLNLKIGQYNKKINVQWDEKRQMFWVSGSGFDFLLYTTSNEIAFALECDYVVRAGETDSVHISIKTDAHNCRGNNDVVETLVFNELSKYWLI